MRDRRAHVRRGHAGDQRAVGESDEAVDDRLRMDDDVEPVRRAGRTGNAPRSVRAPCSSGRPNRSSPSAPSPSWDGRALPRAWRLAMRSALHSRNGPPDAVIVIISIVAGSRAPIAWNSALCSESIGSSSRAGPPRRVHHRGAGADQRLLVGERDRPSRRDRGESRLQPGRADDRRRPPDPPRAAPPPGPLPGPRRPRLRNPRAPP